MGYNPSKSGMQRNTSAGFRSLLSARDSSASMRYSAPGNSGLIRYASPLGQRAHSTGGEHSHLHLTRTLSAGACIDGSTTSAVRLEYPYCNRTTGGGAAVSYSLKSQNAGFGVQRLGLSGLSQSVLTKLLERSPLVVQSAAKLFSQPHTSDVSRTDGDVATGPVEASTSTPRQTRRVSAVSKATAAAPESVVHATQCEGGVGSVDHARISFTEALKRNIRRSASAGAARQGDRVVTATERVPVSASTRRASTACTQRFRRPSTSESIRSSGGGKHGKGYGKSKSRKAAGTAVAAVATVANIDSWMYPDKRIATHVPADNGRPGTPACLWQGDKPIASAASLLSAWPSIEPASVDSSIQPACALAVDMARDLGKEASVSFSLPMDGLVVESDDHHSLSTSTDSLSVNDSPEIEHFTLPDRGPSIACSTDCNLPAANNKVVSTTHAIDSSALSQDSSSSSESVIEPGENCISPVTVHRGTSKAVGGVKSNKHRDRCLRGTHSKVDQGEVQLTARAEPVPRTTGKCQSIAASALHTGAKADSEKMVIKIDRGQAAQSVEQSCSAAGFLQWECRMLAEDMGIDSVWVEHLVNNQ